MDSSRAFLQILGEYSGKPGQYLTAPLELRELLARIDKIETAHLHKGELFLLVHKGEVDYVVATMKSYLDEVGLPLRAAERHDATEAVPAEDRADVEGLVILGLYLTMPSYGLDQLQ